MKSQFNIDIEDSYKIKIIDDTINMLEISDSQYIYLENNGYTVKSQ